MNEPQWATDLIQDAVDYLKQQGIPTTIPPLKWRHTHNNNTGGLCYRDHISINAGTARLDAKLVLLHELAHWSLPIPKGNPDWVLHFKGEGEDHENHTPRFWDLVWILYRHYKLPIHYCKQREGEYRKGALVAYHRSLRRVK